MRRAISLVEDYEDRELESEHNGDTKEHVGHETVRVLATNEVDDEQNGLITLQSVSSQPSTER